MERKVWKVRRGRVWLCGPQVMGIVNATPDSFSDGLGRGIGEREVGMLVERALEMERAGATWVDVGGESTRPGAGGVSEAEELRRVVPVVRALRAVSGIGITVDTSKAGVARAALEAGADAINDVTGLSDPAMAEVVRDAGAGLVLMHSRGTPETMDGLATYADGGVVEAVRKELMERVEVALSAGIAREALVLDPGFGFAKTPAQNEELLRGLEGLLGTGYPMLIGLSRKRFIGERVRARMGREVPPWERDEESAVAAVEAAHRGALLLRVHNVACTVAALGERFDVVDARGEPTGETVFREWAHRLGISHRTSHVWLVRRGAGGRVQILLQKRSTKKDSFPGCYDISSAGHLMAGTDYETSALRELREELGVVAESGQLHPLGVRHIHTESVFHGAPFINDQWSAVFGLECDREETQFQLQASEVEAVRWMELEECIARLEDPSFPNCLSVEELQWLREHFS